MSTAPETQTEAVYNHHLQALGARDLEAIAEDYSEESALIVSSVPVAMHGGAAIRAFFAQTFEVFTPEVIASFRVHRQTIDGEIAYAVWSAGDLIPFASDTFVIRGGKIVVQTAAVQMAQGG